jgi:hypothetical protein
VLALSTAAIAQNFIPWLPPSIVRASVAGHVGATFEKRWKFDRNRGARRHRYALPESFKIRPDSESKPASVRRIEWGSPRCVDRTGAPRRNIDVPPYPRDSHQAWTQIRGLGEGPTRGSSPPQVADLRGTEHPRRVRGAA